VIMSSHRPPPCVTLGPGQPAQSSERRDKHARGAVENFADVGVPWTAPAPLSPLPAPDRVWPHGRRRDPDLGQLADAVKLGQYQCIAAIRLHPIARFDRDKRRRHHDAIVPQLVSSRYSP
jgi:hypothetical protein